MKFLSLAPFVPSGSKYEESKQLFQELGFKLNWDGGDIAGLGADGCNFILQKFDRKEFAENFMLSRASEQRGGVPEYGDRKEAAGAVWDKGWNGHATALWQRSKYYRYRRSLLAFC